MIVFTNRLTMVKRFILHLMRQYVGELYKPAKSKLYYYSHWEFDLYFLSTQDTTFSQYIGTAIILVVPDFQVLLAFLVSLAFQLFRLSDHFSFPIIPAFRSFQSLQSKEFKRGPKNSPALPISTGIT